jgi:hypothetical protein
MLATFDSIVVGLLITILSCDSSCKGCRKFGPRYVKWFTDTDDCEYTTFKPRIMNSDHASTDSLHRRDMALSLAKNVKDAVELEADAAGLTPMNVVITPGKNYV